MRFKIVIQKQKYSNDIDWRMFKNLIDDNNNKNKKKKKLVKPIDLDNCWSDQESS